MENNMEMFVHLHPEVFEIVLNGIKNVEARVNDEKKKKTTCRRYFSIFKKT